MSVGITLKGNAEVPGAHRRQQVVVAGDASYPTGGYAISAAALGFLRIAKFENPVPVNTASAAWDPFVTPTYLSDGSGLIASFNVGLNVSTTGVQVGNGTSVATASYTMWVEGD